jgi:hypothetical protein
LESGLSFGKIVCILHFCGKGHYLDMIEKLHIYKKTAISNKLNDIDVMSLNKICELTIDECPNLNTLFAQPIPRLTQDVEFSVGILILYISFV